MNAKATENLLDVKQYLKESLQISDDRVFVFFYFSYMIKGIKGKEGGGGRDNAKEENRDRESNWKNGSKEGSAGLKGRS